jgi:hypothetical protein
VAQASKGTAQKQKSKKPKKSKRHGKKWTGVPV